MNEQVKEIRDEIVRLRNEHEKAVRACSGLNVVAMTHGGAQKVCDEILAFIDSQPDEHLIDGNKTIEGIKGKNTAIPSIQEQLRREIERKKGKSYYPAMLEIFDILTSLNARKED